MYKSVKRKTDAAYIPPYWVDLTIGLLTICAFYFLVYVENNTIHSSSHNGAKAEHMNNCIGIIGWYITIKSCFNWSLHKDYIIVHFLWIPVRIIRWSSIASAEYIYSWSTGSKYVTLKGQGIAITLKGCPYFNPEIDALNTYQIKHPYRFIFIRFTPRNQKRYVALFQEYYPSLDFQLGYEKNLNRSN